MLYFHPLPQPRLQIPEEMSKCRNSYTEQELRPLSLEELGQATGSEPGDYSAYIQGCMEDLLKEVKDKFKGWVSCPTSEPADLAYKKVPLPRLQSSFFSLFAHRHSCMLQYKKKQTKIRQNGHLNVSEKVISCQSCSHAIELSSKSGKNHAELKS